MATAGEKIRKAREAKSFGQAELAKLAGITPNSLYRIEKGQRAPRPATLRRIAHVLGLAPADLRADVDV